MCGRRPSEYWGCFEFGPRGRAAAEVLLTVRRPCIGPSVLRLEGWGRPRPDLPPSRSWPSPWLAVIISKPSGDSYRPHGNLWDTLERFSLWSSVDPLTVREREKRLGP